ncbi:MAG: hypothetical protein U9R32_05055, partial [Bacteroidota bacterium]|nr:hypothetical protein [Bacteroidota bacterium]
MIQLDIVHYHLNPGGVTKIIESQIKSLRKQNIAYDITVFTSYCPNITFYKELNVKVIQDKIFAYADFYEKDSNIINSNFLKVKKAAEKYFSKNRIIHFHNINLAKNPYWTIELYKLINKGFNIINHAHDFAEDREENIAFMKRVVENHFKYNLLEVMYQNSQNYHHIVLTQKEANRLTDYGVNKKHIHLIPNPTDTEPIKLKKDKKTICDTLHLDKEKILVTYPVRVIRRKNIGELILISVLFSNKVNFVVSQPPANPIEKEFYNQWIIFCTDNNISITFEAGNRVDFETLICSSDFCITTSKKEGFGMIFIEPWIMNTPVVGRNLKNVTDDFLNNGMTFPGLYEKIDIPIGKHLVDFAQLEPEQQKSIIKTTLTDFDFKDNILTLNPFLNTL